MINLDSIISCLRLDVISFEEVHGGEVGPYGN